ncbi:hypothetical protein HK100_010946 [Physocladia obscura]|uniref:Uncharacterized protein n=1 Tax=Physocladia obscura TaxID=109957 RepID=A0AAD5X5I6_9FUNG|nr:hypothetical protein HK100_010946 [Physocladia obscura]
MHIETIIYTLACFTLLASATEQQPQNMSIPSVTAANPSNAPNSFMTDPVNSEISTTTTTVLPATANYEDPLSIFSAGIVVIQAAAQIACSIGCSAAAAPAVAASSVPAFTATDASLSAFSSNEKSHAASDLQKKEVASILYLGLFVFLFYL